MTAMFPENRPPKHRADKIPVNDVDKPKANVVVAVPNVPVRMTGLRPILSDNFAHRYIEQSWDNAKVLSYEDETNAGGIVGKV